MDVEGNEVKVSENKSSKESEKPEDGGTGNEDLPAVNEHLDPAEVDEEKRNDENEAKQCDNAAAKVNQDSFKKPVLLVGPRRGKVGQLKVVPSTNLKDTDKPSAHVQPVKPNIADSDPDASKVKKPAPTPQLVLPYKQPSWGGLPEFKYQLEVLKSGVIIKIIDIYKKSFYVIGRQHNCDIPMSHPTISRYHAVLQYRDKDDEKQSKGFYLYDLGSVHGSFWNGRQIKANTYVKVQGGHMISFGCSKRKLILQAPPDDTEEESELTVTELKEKRRLELLERERLEKESKEREEEMERLRLEKEEAEGISWGMAEDADEETDLTENPYALTNNEELFLDDPKKTLRGWFEREGHDLQYETEEKGIGQFLCWVDLPLDTPTGRPIRAEALVQGKKKEAVIQCALEACRILDRHGVLRQATHEARKRKSRNWEEEDYYDSDEDNYLDRTGSVEKKREQRMRQAGKLEDKVETYSTLLEKHTAVTKKIVDIENQLRKSQKSKESNSDDANEEDALDAFMSNLNATVLNKAEVTKLKLELQTLRKEEERLLKLVNITKPADLPSLAVENMDFKKNEPTNTDESSISRKRPAKQNSHSEVLKKESTLHTEQVCEQRIDEANLKNKKIRSDKSEDVRLKESDLPVEKRTADADVPLKDAEGVIKTSEESRETNVDETNETEIIKKKKKNVKRMQQRAEKSTKETTRPYGDEAYDKDYSMWVPPVDQSGDGKTNLNDKYGY